MQIRMVNSGLPSTKVALMVDMFQQKIREKSSPVVKQDIEIYNSNGHSGTQVTDQQVTNQQVKDQKVTDQRTESHNHSFSAACLLFEGLVSRDKVRKNTADSSKSVPVPAKYSLSSAISSYSVETYLVNWKRTATPSQPRCVRFLK